MLSFNFGGKNSYTDFGIIISKRPSIPSPKRRINTVNIPGRDSNLRFDEKTYDDITIVVECSVKDIENLANKIDNIKAWLFGTGESDLIFSFQDDKKYIAQVVNAIDFKQVFKYTSVFPIIFNCRPFKYSVETTKITTSNKKLIINPGSIESEPIISVYGTGNITLKLDDKEIILKDVKDKIILNSLIQDCYNDIGDNLNNKMTGEFFKLEVGENTIDWGGSVSKIEIATFWRWL